MFPRRVAYSLQVTYRCPAPGVVYIGFASVGVAAAEPRLLAFVWTPKKRGARYFYPSS